MCQPSVDLYRNDLQNLRIEPHYRTFEYKQQIKAWVTLLRFAHTLFSEKTDQLKITKTLPMQRLDAEAAQYLHTRVDDPIPGGAWVVLRKRTDGTFELVVVTQANDATDVTLLASFLDPADVDAIRDTSIASVVLHHKQKRSRRPKASRS